MLRNDLETLFLGCVKSVIVIPNNGHLSVCPVMKPVQLLPTKFGGNYRGAAHQQQ